MHLLFYIEHPYYYHQFEPVIELAAEQEHDVVLIANAPNFPEEVLVTLADRYQLIRMKNNDELPGHCEQLMPDWLICGNHIDSFNRISAYCKTALLYHGIGVKSCYYGSELTGFDIRFVEGEFREQQLKNMYPDNEFKRVGFAKLDVLFQDKQINCNFDFSQLDPDKPTILYAPTFYPSSIECFPEHWPAEMQAYNLLVKPHQFSLTKPQYAKQRDKLQAWSRQKNVWLIDDAVESVLPYMARADVLVSDASSVIFEFAALDKPVVWCDFQKLRWSYKGLLRFRLHKRMDHSINNYRDMALHPQTWQEVEPMIDRSLAQPNELQLARKRVTNELIGETDGKVATRILSYLDNNRY